MNNKLFSALSALLCLAACNTVEKDVEIPEKDDTGKVEVIITASTDTDTKTVLDDNYTTVLWKPSDEIKVFSAGEDSKFTSLNTTTSSIAQFRGMISVITGISEGVGYDNNIYGLYPYNDDATLSNGVITTTLPSTQTAVADSFDDDLFITIGKSETLSMGFYNVCSGLRFSFSEVGYTSVTLSSNNGEALAGTFSVGFDNSGKPVIQSVSSPSTSITVNAPTGGFVANTWYYIICLPGTVGGGITLSATNANASGTYKISSSLTFSRGLFKQVANLDSRLEMTQPNNEIWYEAWDVVTPYNPDAFDANIVSNTFSDGKGVIRFDNDITQIGSMAFYQCSGSLSLPESIISIGDHAFESGCTLLRLPPHLESIGDYAFCYNSSNYIGVLPDGIKTIGAHAFEGSNIFNVIIPASITTIGESAFQDCMSLNDVTLPDNLTVIPARCFAGSIKDTTRPATINIPSSVVSIGANAFAGCKAFPIEILTLPETITDIGEYAFALCSNIKKVYIHATTAAMIGKLAFVGCECTFYVPSVALPGYWTYSETGYYLPFSNIYSFDAEYIEPVDLGLSVKWAPVNIGAITIEDFGNYYSWGEIVPKSYYDSNNYKWYYPENGGFRVYKYFNEPSTGIDLWVGSGAPDNKTRLDPEDDAACMNWGGKWRMPTFDELIELNLNCNREADILNGVNCTRLYNPHYMEGDSLILPYAGGCSPNLDREGSLGYYWTSSLLSSSSRCASAVKTYVYNGQIYLEGVNPDLLYGFYRHYGFTIRPVYVE